MSQEVQMNIVAQLLADNPKMSKAEAMIKANYSPSYANNPRELTRNEKFIKLFDKKVNDKLLIKKHKSLLTIPVKIRTYIKGDLTTEIEELDSQAIAKGLEMAYKIKGSYAPEKHQNTNLNASVKDLLDALQNDDEATLKPDSSDRGAVPRGTTE